MDNPAETTPSSTNTEDDSSTAPARKRGSERQLTKDDYEDENDEESHADVGNGFARADASIIQQRRIIKVRRPGASSGTPATAAGATGSPPSAPGAAFAAAFAVRRPPVAASPHARTPSPTSALTAGKEEANALVTASDQAPSYTGDGDGDGSAPANPETAPAHSPPAPAPAAPGTGAHASLAAAPSPSASSAPAPPTPSPPPAGSGGAAHGGPADATAPGSAASPPPAAPAPFQFSFPVPSSFSSTPFSFAPPAFSFMPPTAPFILQPPTSDSGAERKFGTNIAAPAKTKKEDEEEGDDGETGEEVQHDFTVAKAPVMAEAPASTGEEHEHTVYQLRRAKLYEVNKDSSGSAQYKEKGVGALRLNMDPGTRRSRLIMRVDGTSRLILNAAVFPKMVCEKVNDKQVRLMYLEVDADSPAAAPHSRTALLRVGSATDAEDVVQIVTKYIIESAAAPPSPSPAADAKVGSQHGLAPSDTAAPGPCDALPSEPPLADPAATLEPPPAPDKDAA